MACGGRGGGSVRGAAVYSGSDSGEGALVGRLAEERGVCEECGCMESIQWRRVHDEEMMWPPPREDRAVARVQVEF